MSHKVLVYVKGIKVGWLHRMWWRLTGRGPRYELLFTHGYETDAHGNGHYMTRAELDVLAKTCTTGRENKHGT